MTSIESGREILKSLEAEGRYVFHGSGNADLGALEPRQAYNYKNDIEEPDGEPAVFASSDADYAIFMAIMNKKNCPKGLFTTAGMSQRENGEKYLYLRANKETIDQLDDNSSGSVYVFDKDAFSERDEGGIEYISTTHVAPLHVVTVMKFDLPPSIEVSQ